VVVVQLEPEGAQVVEAVGPGKRYVRAQANGGWVGERCAGGVGPPSAGSAN
jgi:hypothetical protein